MGEPVRFYSYVILFEDQTFYIGARKCPEGKTPFTDNYSGSPVTHKEKWKNTPFRKRILCLYKTEEELISAEIDLLNKVNWKDNPRCLNENNGGMFSTEVCSKGGKIGGKTTAQRLKEDPSLAERRSSRLSESHKKRYAENPEVYDRQVEMARRALEVANGVNFERRLLDPNYQAGINTKISEAKKARLQVDENYKEELIKRARRAKLVYDEMFESDPEFREKILEIRKRFSSSTADTIWVTDGTKNKRIKPNEPIPQGFRRGRTVNKRKK